MREREKSIEAIVDVENVYRRLKENNKKNNPDAMLRVVFDASKEIRNSIIFATSINIEAIIPQRLIYFGVSFVLFNSI